MKINVADFMKNKTAKKDLHLSVTLQDFDDGLEEIKVLSPVEVEGSIFMTGNILNLKASISTDLELTCSRCLMPFKYRFDGNVDEKFTLNSDSKDDDVIFMESDTLDITEIIENNIILSLPIKRLCSDSCKGLCQICGANLNLTTCNCRKDDLDPRLAKLKDMFSTD